MSQKTVFQSIILSLLLVVLGITIFLAPNLPAVERSVAERVLNAAAKDFFGDSIRVGRAAIDFRFRVRLENIRGNFRTREGPVPLEIQSLVSRNSLLRLLVSKPVEFVFEGVRPQGSARPGVLGQCSFQNGKDWRFELLADLNETNLEDVRWIDPQNLSGATGTTRGKIRFVQEAGQGPVFDMDLEAPQPGGALQAKFFDLFLPYLPASNEKKKVARLVSENQRLVEYRTASLSVQMPQSDQMKILLRILVLDYNLNLTLNVTIRTDGKDAFSRIAQIMGFLEVKTS